MAKGTGKNRKALALDSNVRTVDVNAQPGSWFRESSERIQSLGMLRHDWDSYGGEPPNSSSLLWAERAIELLRLMDFRPHWVDPSAEGGVMIAFRHGNRFGSVEYYNTGDIVGLTSDGEGEIDTWPIADDDRSLEEALTRIRQYICG